MFRQARIRLTFLYSIIFLVLFWMISLGIYVWMNRYFGDTKARNNYIRVHHVRSLPQNNITSAEPPSDIVMDELRNVLLIIDVLLFLGIPAIIWFLTDRTLAPVSKAHEREKQFLTDASHDLRTPLSILSSEMEVTLRKERTKEEYKKVILSNKEEVDDLVALTENLLFIARQSNNYQILQKERVDITDLLIKRIIAFQQLAKQKKLQLSFTPPKQSIVIHGNQQLLNRLITSLLDNAVKYTTSKGRIMVGLNQNNHSAIVRVTDSGIGIPEAEQEKVFDRFYRADPARSEKGYGLGLSIAKQIVEYHNGKIHLYSKVGKGTTITLTLPMPTQNRERNQS